MDVNNLAIKIKHLHSETTEQMQATRDEVTRHKMAGYLLALDKVLALIKQAKDVARLEQQLARKRTLLEQEPDAEWEDRSGAETASATDVEMAAQSEPKRPFPVQVNNPHEKPGRAQIAA